MEQIDWESIEEACMNTEGLPDCIPTNIRQWDAFIRQYERATDLVNGKWKPHYNWETEEEFNQAVNEQFYLGKGYKHSIYECYNDVHIHIRHQIFSLLKNVDYSTLVIASRFTKWSLNFKGITKPGLTELPLLPKKVGGNFNCSNNSLTTLKGCPEYVGGTFNCSINSLTSLKGAPNYVGGAFGCSYNKLTSLEGAPNHVGEDFHLFDNPLMTLEGCPEYVGGHFYGYSRIQNDIDHEIQ